MDKEGNVTMEDAAGFFANVFGGERFMAYVSGLCLHIVADLMSRSDRRNLTDERDDFGRDDNDDRRGEARGRETDERWKPK